MQLIGDNNNSISNFNNPFDKDCVDSITFKISKEKSMFRENKRGEATVYFSKGNTSGNQSFYSDDFQDLLKQVDVFIKTLK